MDRSVGIIGFGNMGSAIAERLDMPLSVFDLDALKTANLKDSVKALPSADLVVQNSDAVILAVKPQDFGTLMDMLKKTAQGTNKIFISIAAGIPTGYIEKALGNARVIRAMPNLPAKIGQGITALSRGAYASDDDLDFARKLFSALGKTLIVAENMLNAVTAVSGSGPAYVCYLLEKEGTPPTEEKQKQFLAEFTRAAQAIGFNPEQAALLVAQTYAGTLSFLQKTNITASGLREQVTSKGGTSEAALAVLRQGGSLGNAIKAAAKRADELSKKE